MFVSVKHLRVFRWTIFETIRAVRHQYLLCWRAMNAPFAIPDTPPRLFRHNARKNHVQGRHKDTAS
jgi:hypothetical protein